ncbi:sensor histidine kinase [Emticicia sp. 21SJ11W-3]|uniref:sensor histidine kinase n=1 Tax=Emticicia sp. 21SJ11W-3 TaxID=2916755 RepID=UPI0020A04EC2|nr:sensor histidine kinase [Emticicia sp. 21SJ11W-3]UTA66427.1 sensor histidine kinase [Emticicia sp. 21SJ11W-3]
MVQPATTGAPLDMYVMIIGGTLMLLMMACGIVIFMVLYQRRMLEHRIRIQEAEAKHQRELFFGAMDAIEQERKRLARDLHDEVGASLSVMRLMVNELPTRPQLTTLDYKQLIDNIIDNVRRISNDLLPQGLEEFGLPYAIESLCEKVMAVAGIDINLTVEIPEQPGNTQSLAVYRLLQELLNNAVKHAEATELTLTIRKENAFLSIKYADNGRGFDFVEAYQKRSLGLKNIEARTRLLNGQTRFETSPGAGLRVDIEIPDL